MELTELTLITMVLCSALIGGVLLQRLKQPPLLGYMLAGFALGPTGFALIETGHDLTLLAEIGVTLLVFILGLELSLQSFKKTYKAAIFIVVAQLAGSIAATYIIGTFFNWELSRVLVFGCAISLSSTAVAISLLNDIGEFKTEIGQIAIGVLIAQDLAVPPILIAINAVGGEGGFTLLTALQLGGAIFGLVLLIWYLGRKGQIRVPILSSLPDHSEMIGLVGLSFCFLLAAISGSLGMSAAFGAFMAGLIIGASKDKHRVMETVQPIQVILLILFFLSVGLLVDVQFVLDHLPQVFSLLALMIFVKTIVNIVALKLVGKSWNTAAIAGVSLAQLGEFSFVIAALGLNRGAITSDGYKYLVALIALSLVVSPLWLALARKLEAIRIAERARKQGRKKTAL